MPDTNAGQNSGQTPLWARTVDYIFGRNTLIGVASIMMLVISGYATWHGMRDFIVGVSTTGTKPTGEGFSISNDSLVVGGGVALTFLMWLMLRESFGVKRSVKERLITFPLYAFLALWSIGFGYGFWWSLISGEEATRMGLSGLTEDARDASGIISARLDAVRGQLDSVVTWSDGQMTREETSGGSCGVTSGAGRGPLYNARRSVRDSVTNLRDGMTRSWLAPVQADVEELKKAAEGLEGGTVEERQKRFEAKASEIRGRARNIVARSNELGKSTGAEMRSLAAVVTIAPGAVGFSCNDPTLAQRLLQAAEQAEQPAQLRLREAVFSEGPAGVANAVKNLWKNIGAYTKSMFSYIFTGRAGGSTSDGEPITGRDLIALLATIGIDLGLLALAAINPEKEPPPVRPSGSVVRQINDAIETAIARAPNADKEWVRRHFIHHHSKSYLVTPNLYGADPNNAEESTRALAMNQLAGVLSDLGLVVWPTPKELKWLRDEESAPSNTDLTEIRKKFAEEQAKGGGAEEEAVSVGVIRNHGLFSKAERALQIAGWSQRARADIEIFKLIETAGLTPLLMVLGETRAAGGTGQGQPPAAGAVRTTSQPAAV